MTDRIIGSMTTTDLLTGETVTTTVDLYGSRTVSEPSDADAAIASTLNGLLVDSPLFVGGHQPPHIYLTPQEVEEYKGRGEWPPAWSAEEVEESTGIGEWVRRTAVAEDVVVRRPDYAPPIDAFIPANRHGRRKAARLSR